MKNVIKDSQEREFRKPEFKDIAEITAFKQEFQEADSGMDGTGILVRSSAEEWIDYNQQMERGNNPSSRHCLQ